MSSICGDIGMSDQVGDDSAVNKSYTRLEDVVRNFSREINLYEENISHLSRQLELAEQELGSKDEALKMLTVERDRLKQIHDEDGKARFAVDALVTSYEHKVQILEKALVSFDMSAQDFINRSDALDEFNQQIKCVQLELHRKLKEQHIKNEEASNLYQQKMADCSQKFEDVTNERDKIKKEGEIIKNELYELKTEYTKLLSDTQKLERDLNQELVSAEVQRAKQDEALKISQQNVANITEKYEKLIEERDQIKKEMNVVKNDFLELRTEYTKLSNEKQVLETDLNQKLVFAEADRVTQDEALKISHQNIANITEKFEKLIEERDQIKEEMSAVQNDLVDLRTEYTKLSNEKEILQVDLNQKLVSAEVERVKQDEALKISQQNVANITEKFKKLSEEHDNIKEMLNAGKNELLDLRNEYTNLSCEKELLQVDLNENLVSAEVERAKQDEALKISQQNVADITEKLGRLTEERELIQKEMTVVKNELLELRTEYTKLLNEKQVLETDLNQKLVSAEEDLVKHGEALKVSHQNAANIAENLEKLIEERDKIKNEVDSVKQELQDSKTEYSKCLREKQDIENQLLIQMRATKEKDAELQDNVKQNTKQLQLVRSGYEDLAAILEMTKSEKLALTESYTKLTDDKKQAELSLNEELSAKTDKIKVLLEEVESLRLVQKRYTDLKRHLSSLMKEKSNSQTNSKAAICKTNDSDVAKTHDLNHVNPTSVSAFSQDEHIKDKKTEPRPAFQRSHPVTPSRRPGSILKSPVDSSEKKNVSFGSPLTFCVGLTSSSESSSEAENNKDSQKVSQKRSLGSKSKDLALSSTPQKRSIDSLSQKKDQCSPEKKAKLSENDSPEGRKFFRKKAVKCPPPAYKIPQK